MHAYIIYGHDKSLIEKEIDRLAGKDTQRLEYDISKIASVRKLTHLTAFTNTKKVAYILRDIDKATIDAQNAFLKNLEEGTLNILFILTAKNRQVVPKTIISRCVEVRTLKGTLDPKTKKGLERFCRMSPGEMLNFVSDYKSKDEAVSFLENLIFVLHEKILTGEKTGKIITMASGAMACHKAIVANGNVNLQLTNFIVTL